MHGETAVCAGDAMMSSVVAGLKTVSVPLCPRATNQRVAKNAHYLSLSAVIMSLYGPGETGSKCIRGATFAWSGVVCPVQRR
jgi:hypothetical protein